MELALTDLIPALLTSAGTEAATTDATDALIADAAGTMAPTAGITGLDTAVVPSILTGGEGVASIAPEFAGLTDTAGITSNGILAASPEAAGLADAATGATTAAESAAPDFMGQGAKAIDSGLPATNEITGQAYDITQGANSAPGVNLSDFANPPGQGIPTQALEKGITDPFAQGASSASDLFSKVTDKLGGWADKSMAWAEKNPLQAGMLGVGAMNMLKTAPKPYVPEKYNGPLDKYHLASNYQAAKATPTYYTPSYQQAAQGGIMNLAMGGPATTPQPGQMYPQSQQEHTQFATPTQMPASAEVIGSDYEPATNPYTGDMLLRMAEGGETKANPLVEFYKEHINPKFKEVSVADTGIYTDTDPDTIRQDAFTAALTRQKKLNALTKPVNYAPQQIVNPQLQQAQQQAVEAASGGIMGYNLGGYASGGNPRLLKGPGDGMSDNIPATIADRQPARLADGEFVVPADVVSHLGNGSTDAGAKHLYTMMDKVRMARTGKKAQGPQINPTKFLPK